jgi:hypothetical protein
MNQVASTKDKTKLIIADSEASNALVLEYLDNGEILVSVCIDSKRKEQVLHLDCMEAKSAIIDYLIDHLR